MDWMMIDKVMKQKRLNFKLDRNKRGRPHKCNANDKSGGGNLKSKFRKAINISRFEIDHVDNGH